ncbi:hypothetical protein [Burkholderia ubonensis]|uniref:hypothetical protein n=1 Tax=Burkholderia ubonensis TaxID=101571 RepID=UPI000A5E3159|nr:hypothetical protein [Burkholderia ubonensis]
MTMRFYKEMSAAAGAAARSTGQAERGVRANIFAFVFVAPFIAAAVFMWMMSQDPNWYSYADVSRTGMSFLGHIDRWALLTPILIVDAVLAAAILPFLRDLGDLGWIVRQSGTFAFAWCAMVLAAAIYAGLPVYLIAALALGLTFWRTRTDRYMAEAAQKRGGTYWLIAIGGLLPVLWLTIKVVMSLGYTKQQIAAGEPLELHFDALFRFAIFGSLGVLSAYLMCVCIAIRGAGQHYRRFAVDATRAWLIQKGIAPTPANINAAISERRAVIDKNVGDALTADGYPADFWLNHQTLLGTPFYGFLFFAGAVIAWLFAGFGWSLMLPADIAAYFNEASYGVQSVRAKASQNGSDGHTLV